MSTVSMRFPYKEKRKGKITKIALTRSSSTPSNPYGSRAEACQPETMISAACQGMGTVRLREGQPVEQGAVVDRLSGFPKRPYKRKKKNFYCLPFYRGRWGGCLASATSPIAPAALPPDLAMAAQTARRG